MKYHIFIVDKNIEENKIEICDLIPGYTSYEDINVIRVILNIDFTVINFLVENTMYHYYNDRAGKVSVGLIQAISNHKQLCFELSIS